MTPDALARIHARAFHDSRPWTSAEFAGLLASPHVFLVSGEACFALGRVVADEAELLTIATDPSAQGQGRGRAQLRAFEDHARDRGAETAFLEVAADNHPARALYDSAGYQQDGLRKAYYPRASAPPADALLLRKPL